MIWTTGIAMRILAHDLNSLRYFGVGEWSCWYGMQTHIDGLVQDCSISSALAMEIRQFCTKPSISSVLRQQQLSRAGTSNYIPHIQCDVIACPCHWYPLPAHTSSYINTFDLAIDNITFRNIELSIYVHVFICACFRSRHVITLSYFYRYLHMCHKLQMLNIL